MQTASNLNDGHVSQWQRKSFQKRSSVGSIPTVATSNNIAKLTYKNMMQPSPCPFCGGEAKLNKALRDGYEQHRDDPDAYAYYYFCRSCAAHGGWAKSDSGALQYWNMRPGRRGYQVSTEPACAGCGFVHTGGDCPRL